MSKLEGCVLGVLQMNNIINAGKPINLEAQVRVVREEGRELYNAVTQNEGPEQVLKETIDVLVTAFGALQALIEQGYDVFGAWEAVNENNMSKFPDEAADAIYTAEAYAASGIATTVSQDPVSSLFVIRNNAGKALKPHGYIPVDLKAYLPMDSQGETL